MCTHFDLLLDLGASALLPANGDLRAMLGQPERSIAHEVGGKEGEEFLQAQCRTRTDLQVMGFEDLAQFPIAGFDGLAGIVEIEPGGQIITNQVLSKMQQAAVAICFAGPEALASQVERIGTAGKLDLFPGDHVSIAADLLPGGGGSPASAQLTLQPVAMRLGVDLVAHLDQQSDILGCSETGVQADDDRQRVAVLGVLRPEALQPLAQLGTDRLLSPDAFQLPLVPILALFERFLPAQPAFLQHFASFSSFGQFAVRSFRAILPGVLLVQLCETRFCVCQLLGNLIEFGLFAGQAFPTAFGFLVQLVLNTALSRQSLFQQFRPAARAALNPPLGFQHQGFGLRVGHHIAGMLFSRQTEPAIR